MFKEYTALWLQDEESNDPEVFIHINKNGKIKRAYCWSDHIPETILYTDRDYKIKKAKTTPCNNSLFRDLTVSFIVKNLHRIFICEDFEEMGKDEYLLKAISNYKNLQV